MAVIEGVQVRAWTTAARRRGVVAHRAPARARGQEPRLVPRRRHRRRAADLPGEPGALGARATDEPVQRPDDFDLAAAWRSIVIDARRPTCADTRWACGPTRGTADVLGYVFGTRMVERVSGSGGRVDGPDDGPVDLEIRAQSDEMMARQLAGFADAIEVLWPESVRLQLADIGRSLVAHHGAAAAGSRLAGSRLPRRPTPTTGRPPGGAPRSGAVRSAAGWPGAGRRSGPATTAPARRPD